jgi:hypothetical protein
LRAPLLEECRNLRQIERLGCEGEGAVIGDFAGSVEEGCDCGAAESGNDADAADT